jgi:hypothetical protein
MMRASQTLSAVIGWLHCGQIGRRPSRVLRDHFSRLVVRVAAGGKFFGHNYTLAHFYVWQNGDKASFEVVMLRAMSQIH